MPKGYLCLVLHAHLPFVRHPEYASFLEEEWLFEAINETYLPLLDVFQGLAHDGVPFRICVSLSPTLMNMLVDPFLQSRYLDHLDRLIDLAEKEVERTKWQPEFHRLACMYRDRFHHNRWAFTERYGRNIVGGFAKLQESGHLEVLTSAATHGFLPLLDYVPSAVRAQVIVGAEEYARIVGRRPVGMWLPECGYHPGHEQYLAEAGIRYFLADAHGLLHASPRPRYANYAPVFTRAGVAVFGRDLESSKQVWSASEGYPGDFEYRDFYRDVGFDLDDDYVAPYVQPDGTRIATGIKYYRITGRTVHKEVYDPDRAAAKADVHAGNFLFNRERQVEYLASHMDRKPVVVAPYDAELFGHWWFEGPRWLDLVIRKMAYDSDVVKLAAPSDYLNEYPRNQVSTPSYSSWGWKGYSEVWLNGTNDWIYRHLHKASELMSGLAADHASSEGLQLRALRQAAREVLLAQSSDWPFIMKTGTTVPYAVRRFKDHIGRFYRLHHQIQNNYIEEGWLQEIEQRDNLFPEIDYRVFDLRTSREPALAGVP